MHRPVNGNMAGLLRAVPIRLRAYRRSLKMLLLPQMRPISLHFYEVC